jgi:hypothetical protein
MRRSSARAVEQCVQADERKPRGGTPCHHAQTALAA